MARKRLPPPSRLRSAQNWQVNPSKKRQCPHTTEHAGDYYEIVGNIKYTWMVCDACGEQRRISSYYTPPAPPPKPPSKFPVGTVVRLKTGGPEMSVAGDSQGTAFCQWFLGVNLQSASFPHESLVNVQESKPIRRQRITKSLRAFIRGKWHA